MARVYDITDDIFTLLGQVRRADEESRPHPDALYRELRTAVERAMSNALETGYSRADSEDMGYVLAALADEVTLSRGGELRDFWLPRLLQMHFFQENIAGDGVFERIEYLIRDPGRLPVLRVYYLALLFGFRGKYAVRGGEIELADLMADVGDALRRGGYMEDSGLSPHWARSGDVRAVVKRNMPIVTLGAAALVVAFAVIIGLRCSIGERADEVVEQVQRATETLQTD